MSWVYAADLAAAHQRELLTQAKRDRRAALLAVDLVKGLKSGRK